MFRYLYNHRKLFYYKLNNDLWFFCIGSDPSEMIILMVFVPLRQLYYYGGGKVL